MWTDAEKRAWAPPEDISPSQWAENNRYLPPSMTAEPGYWRNDRTPYLAGVMDAVAEPGVEEVVVLKAAQVGFSEATRNILGYFIDQDPGPAMVVLPSENAAKEVVEERVKPLLFETPALKRHVSSRADDTKLSAIKLDTMSIYTGWAGSPQALASRPIRYALFDEVDKYPPFAGREADPISLGMKRLTTFGHRARALIGSTPTTRTGNVWRRWEACGDQRYFYVPCPHCSHYQTLKWGQVRWPDREDRDIIEYADEIDTQELAWYECEDCGERIRDYNKPKMLSRGVWAGSDQVVPRDGQPRGPKPKAKRVGYRLSSLYSPWLTFSKLAGEFLRAKDDLPAMMDFRNSRLAEPFEDQASTTKPEVFERKIEHSGEPMCVPEWAGLLLATADVQKDHLYYIVRAWGHQYRSALVSHGRVADFDELRELVLERGYQGPDSKTVRPQAVAIDCKYRTDEVYQFAQKAPGYVWPVGGASNHNAPPITERKVKGYEGVIRRMVNPNYWKTTLHGYIHHEDETLWLPHKHIGDDYVRHMTSEHQVLDPKRGVYVWEPVSSGVANHWWDCEYHQCWVAQVMGAASIPPKQELDKKREQIKQSKETVPVARRGNKASWKGRWS